MTKSQASLGYHGFQEHHNPNWDVQQCKKIGPGRKRQLRRRQIQLETGKGRRAAAWHSQKSCLKRVAAEKAMNKLKKSFLSWKELMLSESSEKEKNHVRKRIAMRAFIRTLHPLLRSCRSIYAKSLVHKHLIKWRISNLPDLVSSSGEDDEEVQLETGKGSRAAAWHRQKSHLKRVAAEKGMDKLKKSFLSWKELMLSESSEKAKNHMRKRIAMRAFIQTLHPLLRSCRSIYAKSLVSKHFIKWEIYSMPDLVSSSEEDDEDYLVSSDLEHRPNRLASKLEKALAAARVRGPARGGVDQAASAGPWGLKGGADVNPSSSSQSDSEEDNCSEQSKHDADPDFKFQKNDYDSEGSGGDDQSSKGMPATSPAPTKFQEFKDKIPEILQMFDVLKKRAEAKHAQLGRRNRPVDELHASLKTAVQDCGTDNHFFGESVLPSNCGFIMQVGHINNLH